MALPVLGLKTLCICSFMHFPPQPSWNRFYLKESALEYTLRGDAGNTLSDNGERRWKEPGFLMLWSIEVCLLAPD